MGKQKHDKGYAKRKAREVAARRREEYNLAMAKLIHHWNVRQMEGK